MPLLANESRQPVVGQFELRPAERRAAAAREVEEIDRVMGGLVSQPTPENVVIPSTKRDTAAPSGNGGARGPEFQNGDPSVPTIVRKIVRTQPGCVSRDVVTAVHSILPDADAGLVHATLYRLSKDGVITRSGTKGSFKYYPVRDGA